MFEHEHPVNFVKTNQKANITISNINITFSNINQHKAIRILYITQHIKLQFQKSKVACSFENTARRKFEHCISIRSRWKLITKIYWFFSKKPMTLQVSKNDPIFYVNRSKLRTWFKEWSNSETKKSKNVLFAETISVPRKN